MTIHAERIKLRSTRSPWWTVLTAAVLSLGLAGLQVGVGSLSMPIEPARAAIGVGTFAVPVLMILAALTVTGEYRTGMIRTTFMAVPNRSWLLIAKALVAATFGGICAAVMVIASIALVRVTGTRSQGSGLSFAEAAPWWTVAAFTAYAFLGCVLAVGLGALIRHSAGVVALLVLLPFVVEPLVSTIPRVGERVGPLLPFANAFTFIDVPWLRTFDMWWGPLGALLYFTGVAAVVFVAALVDVNRRDP